MSSYLTWLERDLARGKEPNKPRSHKKRRPRTLVALPAGLPATVARLPDVQLVSLTLPVQPAWLNRRDFLMFAAGAVSTLAAILVGWIAAKLVPGSKPATPSVEDQPATE
jgi:hypothetical protein